MTPAEQKLLDLMAAAEQAGLDPVVEIPDDAPPRSVDLRVMDGDRVAAAIRVYLTGDGWRYEVPARPGGQERLGLRSRHLAHAHQDVTADVLRQLDYWFSRATGLRPAVPYPPRTPEDTPAWVRTPYATT